jgi:hypothetical protein
MNIASGISLGKVNSSSGNRIVRHGMILGRPDVKPYETENDITYELGTILQLDKETCLLVSSMDEQGGACDCVVGNNGFIIKSFPWDEKSRNEFPSALSSRAIPINRPLIDFQLPSGQKAFMAAYQCIGGFVPLGTMLDNGEPHPAAGKGFLLSESCPFSPDKMKWISEQEHYTQIIDLAWDGADLSIKSRYLTSGEFGWTMPSGTGLSSLRYGTGFIIPLSYGHEGIRATCFSYYGNEENRDGLQNDPGWRPEKIGPPFCLDPGNECEASITCYGSQYFIYTRSNDPGRIYCSDDGISYSFLRKFDIGATDPYSIPMIMNQGLDGSHYIATNLKNRIRNPMVAYPLLLPEGNLQDPVILHDEEGIRDWGMPRMPIVDHPIANNIFLDGRWRHIILYRVCDYRERGWFDPNWKEAREYYMGDGPHRPKYDNSGLYAIEIEYDNVNCEPWKFK